MECFLKCLGAESLDANGSSHLQALLVDETIRPLVIGTTVNLLVTNHSNGFDTRVS